MLSTLKRRLKFILALEWIAVNIEADSHVQSMWCQSFSVLLSNKVHTEVFCVLKWKYRFLWLNRIDHDTWKWIIDTESTFNVNTCGILYLYCNNAWANIFHFYSKLGGVCSTLKEWELHCRPTFFSSVLFEWMLFVINTVEMQSKISFSVSTLEDETG